MNVVSLQFARAAGVEPSLARWPHVAMALLFGPLSPASFRLEGPDALPEAPERTVADAEAFGCMPPGGPTPAQDDLLDELMAGRNEPLAAALRVLRGTT